MFDNMTKLVALDQHAHRQVKVDINKVEETWSGQNMVPVVLSEFSKLIVQFPIVFSKNSETGQFVCVALTGFEKGQNLFWYNGGSTSIYTPLNISHLPFYVGQDEHSQDSPVMCIDVNSPALSDSGETLFDENGEATHYLKTAQSQLRALVEGNAQTSEFVATLVSHELLTPLTLDITFENGSKNNVRGLYSVDEVRLSELSDEHILALQKSGLLQLIHIQIASLGQLYALIDKKNKMDALKP